MYNSLVYKSCILIGVEVFGMYHEPDFSWTCVFCKKVEDHMHFHIRVKEVHIIGLDVCNPPKKNKTSFSGYFWNFLDAPDPTGLSVKNRSFLLLTLCLTSCKKTEKN